MVWLNLLGKRLFGTRFLGKLFHDELGRALPRDKTDLVNCSELGLA